jgi:hypothetical protein
MPKLPFGFGKEKKGDPSIPDFFDQLERWGAAERDEAVVKPLELRPATAHPQPAPAPQPATAHPQPASQPDAPASRPAASQPASASPAWREPQPAQAVREVSSQHVAPQLVQGEGAVDQLLELARQLGMESIVAPVESLKRLASQLEEEEKKIQKELERLQNKLNLIRATRNLLERIGV